MSHDATDDDGGGGDDDCDCVFTLNRMYERVMAGQPPIDPPPINCSGRGELWEIRHLSTRSWLFRSDFPFPKICERK